MFSATRALAPVARVSAAPRAFLSRRVGPAETNSRAFPKRRAAARARARAALFPAIARRGFVLAAANSAGVDSEPASASASRVDDVVVYAFNDDGSATVSAIALDVAAEDADIAALEASVARDPAATLEASASMPTAARAPAPPASPAPAAPAALAAPAAPGRVAAEGQHEESAMAAFTSDDMLCMLYGVDQDKEDAKHKVAFFDVDAVVDPEALRRVLAAAAAESRRPDSTASVASSATNEIAAPAPDDAVHHLVARFEAARSRCPAWARVALAPAFALITLLLRVFRVFRPETTSPETTSPEPFATSPFASLRGASCAEADTSRLATALHETHVAPAVYPEAERYAKQLRYDGYKIVLVSSAPEFLVAPLGRALGASRVIGAVLEETAEGTFTGAFAATPDAGCGDGEAKRNRVESFARDAGVSLSNSIAYARAGTDAALMRRVGKAYAVSPDESLASRAEAEGWRTLRWAEDAATARERQAAAEEARVAAAARFVAPKNAASRGWTIVDPDQYDPENAARSR